MEDVGDDAQQTEAARNQDEFIFLPQFLEDLLLEFLGMLEISTKTKATKAHDSREGEIASPGLSHRWASVRLGRACGKGGCGVVTCS